MVNCAESPLPSSENTDDFLSLCRAKNGQNKICCCDRRDRRNSIDHQISRSVFHIYDRQFGASEIIWGGKIWTESFTISLKFFLFCNKNDFILFFSTGEVSLPIQVDLRLVLKDYVSVCLNFVFLVGGISKELKWSVTGQESLERFIDCPFINPGNRFRPGNE